MAVREVLLYPHPVLKQKCEPLDPLSELGRSVATDLVDSLDSGPGVGLAAPQIGLPYRAILVDATRSLRHTGQGRFLMFNPVIQAASGQQVMREGCLSIPEYTGNVTRALDIVVDGLDREGQPVRIAATGFEAVVFQHEIDHLDGILFLDRITNARKDLFKRKPKVV
ncbi:MAG: peptide deformylase [Actinomycetota bacterium]